MTKSGVPAPGFPLPSTPSSKSILLTKQTSLPVNLILSLLTKELWQLPFTYSPFIYYRRPFVIWPCLYSPTSFHAALSYNNFNLPTGACTHHAGS